LKAVRQRLLEPLIVAVVDARGASVRNFGFVTVTGQDRDAVWRPESAAVINEFYN